VAVINSYFSDFHCRAISGSCGDSQAIAGGNSTVVDGPFLVRNNYLEGAAQSVLFGGGPALFVVADVTIQYNDSFKPMTWNPGDPSYDGGTAGRDGVKHPWIVKNHFELKNCNRCLLEGNYLQNVWGGFSQVGAAILVTAKNQAATGGANVCPICAVTNVTVRLNRTLYAGQALQVACAPSDNGGWPAACAYYSMHDLDFQHLQYASCYHCNSFTNAIGGGGATVLHDVSIVNNTYQNDGWMTPASSPAASNANGVIVASNPPPGSALATTNLHFDRNIFDPGNYGIYNAGGGAGNCWSGFYPPNALKSKIATCWPNGTLTGNQFTLSIPFQGYLPWPDGNGPTNPAAGANQAAIDAALAHRH
jgi:hypothetical protein